MTQTSTYAPEKTRQELLDAAYDEIWKHGFRSASLDNILQRTGVTKGALYHHFRNKTELGYAVVDEIVREKMRQTWIEPLRVAENPVDALLRIGRDQSPEEVGDYCRFGCPLNNLAQEMSPIDEGFRIRLDSLYREWRDAISEALLRGQTNDFVRNNIKPDQVAVFIIALCEGAIGMAKNAQSSQILESCFEGLSHYIEALRPRRSFRKV